MIRPAPHQSHPHPAPVGRPAAPPPPRRVAFAARRAACALAGALLLVQGGRWTLAQSSPPPAPPLPGAVSGPALPSPADTPPLSQPATPSAAGSSKPAAGAPSREARVPQEPRPTNGSPDDGRNATALPATPDAGSTKTDWGKVLRAVLAPSPAGAPAEQATGSAGDAPAGPAAAAPRDLRDPTAPTPLMRNLLDPMKPESKGLQLPPMALRGRVLGGAEPPAAMVEVDRHSYLVRQGNTLTVVGAAYGALTIQVLEVSQRGVRMEVQPQGLSLLLD